MKKGVSPLISSVLYVAIVLTAVMMAFNYGMPVIERMQDTNAITSSIDSFQEVNSLVSTVASEGKYSARTLSLNPDRGQYRFDNETGELYYTLETRSNFISSHTSQRRGNILITSDASVSVNESSVDGTPCYRMENEYLEVCIKNVSEGSNIDTSDILVQAYNKKLEEYLNSTLTVLVNGNEDTITGTGYTEAERIGDNLGRGRVTVTVNSDYGIIYDVHLDLISGSDFIKAEVSEK